MGSGINNGTTRKLETRVSQELADYVEGMARLGLHGSSVAEVVRYFVKRGVEDAIRSQDIQKCLADKELLERLSDAEATK